jgi:hypothetical protein
MSRAAWFLPLPLVPLVLVAACSSSGPNVPTVAAARTFRLEGFEPGRAVPPRRPVRVSFSIRKPDGAVLASYRSGAGPHTGVHLIYVRRDLGVIIHHHPRPATDGRVDDSVVFPLPGSYRVLVDAYPSGRANFQLYGTVSVTGRYRPKPLPGFTRTVDVDGYRVELVRPPRLRPLRPAFVRVDVTRADGSPARFTPWFGALAHAIFFRGGSLDYFHTHVCGARTPGCTTAVGSRPVGRSSQPGRLNVGILLPEPGTWRLFLQFKTDGRVETAPFTLNVR